MLNVMLIIIGTVPTYPTYINTGYRYHPTLQIKVRLILTLCEIQVCIYGDTTYCLKNPRAPLFLTIYTAR